MQPAAPQGRGEGRAGEGSQHYAVAVHSLGTRHAACVSRLAQLFRYVLEYLRAVANKDPTFLLPKESQWVLGRSGVD